MQMSKCYSRYHTNVKLCYSLGIEKQIFPKEFLQEIPKTTSQYWKKKNNLEYYGSQYEEIAQCTTEELKLIADNRAKQMRKTFVSFLKVYFMIIELIDENKFKQIIKSNYRQLVPLIENLISVTDNKNLILKLLKISPFQFGQWQKMRRYECKESLIWVCYKRESRQISWTEIITMKRLLKDNKFLHWSSGSVWGKAVKDGKISMSIQSWYHYAKLLGLGQNRKKFYKKRKRISVRAEKPNEIWHMDVTRFKTSDGNWAYIYTLMDNFSRRILSWNVNHTLSGKIRLESLKRAIVEQFGNKTMETNNLDLIVDGGSENNNINIHEFIKNCKIGIDKKIALKDVSLSNSMIEGNNRILKQTYLKDKTFSFEELENYLAIAINEYNTIKPHYFHKIYTPTEIYEQPELKNTKLLFDKINKDRIANNKNYSCGKVCP